MHSEMEDLLDASLYTGSVYHQGNVEVEFFQELLVEFIKSVHVSEVCRTSYR
jgi:phosphopantetheine adenylyltransferase